MSQPNALQDLGFVRDARVSYDAIAEEYARRFPGGLGHRPLGRALLSGFVQACVVLEPDDVGTRPRAFLLARGPEEGPALRPR